MEPPNNPTGADGESGKSNRTRRSWITNEEDVLMSCLLEIVRNGWKADNGFKAGYLRELERGMRAAIPGTDLRGLPHINSKVHVWKREYSSISDALAQSGIGWNWTTHTFDVTEEPKWLEQTNRDLNLRPMRFKQWPSYPSWHEIFGKDRATGEHAVDSVDLFKDILKNSETGESASVDKKSFDLDDLEIKPETTPLSKLQVHGGKGKGKGVKRKICDTEIGSLVNSLGDFMKSSEVKVDNLAQQGKAETSEPKMSRATLNDMMKLIPGLTVRDRLRMCDELVQNNARLELFVSLSCEEQAEYVWMLLDGSLK